MGCRGRGECIPRAWLTLALACRRDLRTPIVLELAVYPSEPATTGCERWNRPPECRKIRSLGSAVFGATSPAPKLKTMLPSERDSARDLNIARRSNHSVPHAKV